MTRSAPPNGSGRTSRECNRRTDFIHSAPPRALLPSAHNLHNARFMKRAPGSEPFYEAVPLFVVALFLLNNFWFKSAFPGGFTGKLSDICACFFVPLFVAAALREFTSWTLKTRLHCGAAVMVLSLLLVKGTETGSALLNSFVASATSWSGLTLRPNLADPTDLWALPVVLLSYLYAHLYDRSLRHGATRLSSAPLDPSTHR